MIQSFEIFERFQNIALGKLWSVFFLLINFFLWLKLLTRGQCEHYVNRVVNCLIFVLPAEECFWIHIERYDDELIEVFYRICIANHFSTSNWPNFFDTENTINQSDSRRKPLPKALLSPSYISKIESLGRNCSNSILVV